MVLLGHLFCSCVSADAKQGAEIHSFYIVPVPTRSHVDLIVEAGIEIRHRTPEGVVVKVGGEDLKKLQSLGFNPLYLPRDPALPTSESLRDEVFHLNPDVEQILDQIAQDYPIITRRFTLGESVEGRPIHGIVISHNISQKDDEVEVRVLGCHHGNELMSVEIPLMLAQYLTENYNSSQEVKDLVDSEEIYIVPLVNPDGRHVSSRNNANNVDLNRNYGYQYYIGGSGDHSGSGAFSQPEIRAVADHHLLRNFVLSFSYHTTAAYVNYLWNYVQYPSPDESLLIELSDRYSARSGYITINGYDWYQTYGDTNDWSYGARGDLDWTIETENSNIQTAWERNRPAIMDAFVQARRGVRGLVRDAETGNPLHAMILCDNPHWPVYTDPEVGDYHRILQEGTYSFTVWAPGYQPVRVENVDVSGGGKAVRRDVSLSLGGSFYAFQAVATTTHYLNWTFTPALLGPPDGDAFDLTKGGFVILDMLVGMDMDTELAVYTAEDNNDTYKVYFSNDYTGPWIFLGEANGDFTFDVMPSNRIAGFRYVKIEDVGVAGPSIHSGALIDAVEYFPNEFPDGDTDAEVDEDHPEEDETEEETDYFEMDEEDAEEDETEEETDCFEMDEELIDNIDDFDEADETDEDEIDPDYGDVDEEFSDTDCETDMPDGDAKEYEGSDPDLDADMPELIEEADEENRIARDSDEENLISPAYSGSGGGVYSGCASPANDFSAAFVLLLSISGLMIIRRLRGVRPD